MNNDNNKYRYASSSIVNLLSNYHVVRETSVERVGVNIS